MRLECGNCYAVNDGEPGDECPACEAGHLGVWEKACLGCGEHVVFEHDVWVHAGGDVSCPHWFGR